MLTRTSEEDVELMVADATMGKETEAEKNTLLEIIDKRPEVHRCHWPMGVLVVPICFENTAKYYQGGRGDNISILCGQAPRSVGGGEQAVVARRECRE